MRSGKREPFVTDTRLAFSIGDLVVKNGATSVASVTIRGAPALMDASVTPSRRLAFRGIALDAAGIAWPAGAPARLRLGVDLPDSGTLAATGTVALATRALDLAVELKDAALAPYGAWLPVQAPLGGRAEATLTVNGGFGEALSLGVMGTVAAHALALGGAAQGTPLTLERVAVTGLDLSWPSRLAIERVTLTKPHALLERNKDGSFPLREMFTPRASPRAEGPAPGPPAAAPPAADPTPPPPATSRSPMALEIDEIVVEDGDTRFVDHSTTPFFSEEISRLALTLRGFRNTPDARADVAVHAVVGPRGALELSGQVAPLGQPFYLDLAGELRDIAMAQANPYMRFYSGWIARTGSVTTKVHYRIVGDELEASNDVHVQKIRVERAPGADAGVSKRVGLPLGLIVAMITDARGDIEFKVPVAGKLGTPGWSFGDAIWSAIKNVLVNVAAAPFRAIGKLFGGGGGDAEAEQFQVDPVRFAAGSADVSPDAQQQLQRVADFMRASPYVKIAIEPVVSAEDVLSLKTQEVVARVQRAQRERALADFAAAVAAVCSDAALPPPLPKTTDEMIALLRDREPSPDAAIRRLAARRTEVARTTLIETAGIEPARLQERDGVVSVGDAAAGRVQFELVAE